jgi:hypothetical protein
VFVSRWKALARCLPCVSISRSTVIPGRNNYSDSYEKMPFI